MNVKWPLLVGCILFFKFPTWSCILYSGTIHHFSLNCPFGWRTSLASYFVKFSSFFPAVSFNLWKLISVVPPSVCVVVKVMFVVVMNIFTSSVTLDFVEDVILIPAAKSRGESATIFSRLFILYFTHILYQMNNLSWWKICLAGKHCSRKFLGHSWFSEETGFAPPISREFSLSGWIPPQRKIWVFRLPCLNFRGHWTIFRHF